MIIDGLIYSYSDSQYKVLASSHKMNRVYCLDINSDKEYCIPYSVFEDSAVLSEVPNINMDIEVLTLQRLCDVDLACDYDLIILPILETTCRLIGDDWLCKGHGSDMDISYYLEQHASTPAICCKLNFTFKE